MSRDAPKYHRLPLEGNPTMCSKWGKILTRTQIKHKRAMTEKSNKEVTPALSDKLIGPNANATSRLATIFLSIYLFLVIYAPHSVDAKKTEHPLQYRTAYACEGSQLTISCEEGTHINLIRSNFGRFSISICNQHGNLEWSVNCMSSRSSRVIQETCNRRKSCLLPASSGFFGDPCPGTYKYLEVHYECAPIVPRRVHGSRNDTVLGMRPKVLSPPPIIIPTVQPMKVTSDPPTAPSAESNQEKGSRSSIIITTVSSTATKEGTAEDKAIYVPHPYPRFPGNRVTSGPKSGEDPIGRSRDRDRDRDGDNDADTNDGSDPVLVDSHDPSSSASSSTSSTTSTSSPEMPPLVSDPVTTPSADHLKADHCPPAIARGLRWNWTAIGNVAYQQCPGGSKGFARWFCAQNTPVPEWIPPKPDFSDCSSLWMINLEERINRGESVVGLANELAEMTCEKNLYGGDVFRATDIINQLVSRMEGAIEEFPDDRQRNQIVKELLTSIQDTSSNLLETLHQESWFELPPIERKGAASSLVYGLERNGQLLAETKHSASDYIRAHDNIYLSIHVRDVQDFHHQHHSGLNLPLLGEEEEEDAESSLDSRYFHHFQGNGVHLPSETLLTFAQNGLIKTVFVMYKKLDTILEPELIRDYSAAPAEPMYPGTNSNVTTILNSDIIGVLLGQNSASSRVKTLVRITFRHLLKANVSNPRCVFWDTERRDWSGEGCVMKWTNYSHTLCECNHLTNFALFMDISESPLIYGIGSNRRRGPGDPEEAVLRTVITMSSVMSLFLLLVCAITLLVVLKKSLRSDRLLILASLFINQAIYLLLLLLGFSPSEGSSKVYPLLEGYPSPPPPSQRAIGLLVAFLHYLLLVCFILILSRPLELYMRVASSASSSVSTSYLPSSSPSSSDSISSTALPSSPSAPSWRKWLHVLCYTVPAFIIFCLSWFSSSTAPTSWPSSLCSVAAFSRLSCALIAVAVLVMLINVSLVLMSFAKMRCESNHFPANIVAVGSDKSSQSKLINHRKSRRSIIAAFLLTATVCFTWSLGLLYSAHSLPLLGYLFAAANSFLAAYVFVYYCLSSVKVRQKYTHFWGRLNLIPICLRTSTKSDHFMDRNCPGLAEGCSGTLSSKTPAVSATNLTQEPMINSSTSMAALTGIPASGSKYYLTNNDLESGSDYGCRRLQSHNQAHFYHLYAPKQPCNPYSCHHIIEHVYECIDEDPYVAKVLLPSASSSIPSIHSTSTSAAYRLHHPYPHLLHHQDTNGQQFRSSSRYPHRTERPLIGLTTGSGHSLKPRLIQSIPDAGLPAIVRDNKGRTTIICGSKSTQNIVQEQQEVIRQQNQQQAVLAVLGSNNKIVSSCVSEGIDI